MVPTTGGHQMRFAWGVVGGVTPEAYRLWLLRSEGWLPPRKAIPGTAIMIVMSGLFSQALAAQHNPLAAIYIGLSTPYLISCLLARAQAHYAQHGRPVPPGIAPTTTHESPEQEVPRVDTLSSDVSIHRPRGYTIGIFARALIR
jgi:hypothetical protein